MTLKKSYFNEYSIETKFLKKIFKNYYSNSWPSLISKSVSTDISCRLDFADLLTAPYFHFDWLATLYLREGFPEKLTAGKIHAEDKTCQHWVVGAPCALIDWLSDLGPWNRDFYTGLIDLPKFHRILKEMSGLWSSAKALHIQKSQKPPCLIEDPWGHRFRIFSNRIFCSDFIAKFVNINTLLRDHTDANIFPGQVSKSFGSQINDLYFRSERGTTPGGSLFSGRNGRG